MGVAVVLSALFNPALAISNALGAIIYIGVYTIWLKPRTILNIVIGGAAGSMAVISGGAAAHAWNEPGVLALALLDFLSPELVMTLRSGASISSVCLFDPA